MKLRRASLAFATATAVALSGLPSIAGAQEANTPSTIYTAESDVDQWPGSSESSSMLLDGTIPPAPSFGSSEGGTDTEVEEEESSIFDENGNIPIVGSISLPGWVAIPFGILQLGMVVTTFMAKAAYAILSITPNGPQILRDWMISVGINPDA